MFGSLYFTIVTFKVSTFVSILFNIRIKPIMTFVSKYPDQINNQIQPISNS